MTTGTRGTGSSGEGELLSRRCDQVTERSAASHGALPAAAAAAGPREAGVSPGISRAPQHCQGSAVPAAGPHDTEALTELYHRHYSALVRLAALLVRDFDTAEAIVQDSFVALSRDRRRLASDLALSYLRHGVVTRSRSAVMHLMISDVPARCAASARPAAGQQAPIALECPAIISALGVLPARQREALVLRYYGDLPETQIAPVMGVSLSAVRRHTARAMASMRTVLDVEHDLHHCD
jgi:DNA-directed RNA polymerase specialized sigma24 family protein